MAIKIKNFDFHEFTDQHGEQCLNFGLLVNIPPAYTNTIIADIP